MLNIIIPAAPIKLDGFPLCAKKDKREVATEGGLCALCGGPPASLEIVRRSMHRQIRTALREILGCGNCKAIPPNEARCSWCAWVRGAIMGICGIGEQVWGLEEFDEYLKIVSVYDPGWQNRVKWV